MRRLAAGLAIGVTSVLLSDPASPQTATYIAQNATITSVAAVANDTTAFSVMVSSGPCATSGITFYLSSMPSSDVASLQRSYATALLAFSTGAPVNIATFSGSSCNAAVMIQII